MFSLTGHALCVGSAFSPVTLLWQSFPALSLGVGRWREEGRFLFGGPRPLVSIFLLLLCFPGLLLGRPGWPGAGRRGAAVRGGEETGEGAAAPSLVLHRGCGVPGMGLDKGLMAGCPPGPRPWMSTRGTRGRCSWGWGAGGVRYMLLYMAAAAAAAVVLSMLPSRLGW